MLFNSYSFIFLFLPVVFAGMFWLGKYSHRLAALWLGLASLSFYAFWDTRFVLLLLASIAFNYGAGYWIGLRRTEILNKQAKITLIAAISANLILLGYFKYTNFFITSANNFFGGHIPALDIILPLGISFFTFTQIAFLVDVYRGIAREVNFIHYLLFVTYFPHLIAGPVLHHKQMMPQFANPETYRINAKHVAVGLTIFVLGLSKKVLIADNLAEYATPVFDAVRDGRVLMLFEAWIGSLAYTLQLYFDFSGYSDMAIGLSLMFNVRLPLNFDSPYKATSIIDFWRRWHMTLSTFLRDYLYFPLGGNRKGLARRYVNLMATMLLGGLWHGAGWTFIVWGGLHGLYLMINHGWRELKARLGWGEGGWIAQLVAGGLTFLAVMVAWVFFRADSFASAISILSSMAGMNGLVIKWSQVREPLELIVPCLILVWLFPNVRQMLVNYKPTWEDIAGVKTPATVPQGGLLTSWLTWRPTSKCWLALIGILFGLSLAKLGQHSEFLYFQF
jgi:D-alanyl-lipoteichoic acid acyltransferase DltB (MBOAT superfamily)